MATTVNSTVEDVKLTGTVVGDEIESQIEEGEFDLNSPEVLNYVPEDAEDPDGEPVERVFPPAMEGNQWVVVKLREEKENKPSVKIAQNKNGGFRVQANVVPRVYNRGSFGEILYDDAEQPALGGFLKDWYPSTMLMQGQTISELGFILKQVGRPFKQGATMAERVAHVKEVFEEAGEAGISVPVFVQWIRSEKVTDDEGNSSYKDKAKGSKKIADLALREANARAKGDPNGEALIEFAKANPFVYFDEEGNQRSVQAQVARTIPSAKADQAEADRNQAKVDAETEAADGATN